MVSTRPYIAVLKDLERRRDTQLELLKKANADLEELISLIAGLRRVVVDPPNFGAESSAPQEATPKQHPAMSMRWAILNILGVHSSSPMSVSGVVAALIDMGFADNLKLRGNTSAVLSRMGGLGEVVNAGNSYSITELGLQSLQTIQLKNTVVSTDSNMSLYSSRTDTDEEEGD